MIRKASIVVGIAAVHFIAAKIIVALTMQMGMFAAGSSRRCRLSRRPFGMGHPGAVFSRYHLIALFT